jgi:methyl-accepting chemotaxis protein
MGELAFWFNVFMDDIEEIVGRVRTTSNRLYDTAEDVNASSRDLSRETQAHAVSMEEVSTSISQMNAAISKNDELVIEGRKTSGVVTGLIDQNRQVFSDLMEAIREISNDSRKIGDIISTVNEVAFHTNLLALNASVEAARAGEHGKGFAVVAEEVRALAQRSAEAAKQIKNLIEDTVRKIGAGDVMVKKSRESLEEIITYIEDLSQTMDEIAAASSEQATGVDELNRAVAQIDNTTQQNSTTVEQIASTSDSLSHEARELTSIVGKFKVSDKDKGGSSRKPAAAGSRRGDPAPEPLQKRAEPVERKPRERTAPLPQSEKFDDFEEF